MAVIGVSLHNFPWSCKTCISGVQEKLAWNGEVSVRPALPCTAWQAGLGFHYQSEHGHPSPHYHDPPQDTTQRNWATAPGARGHHVHAFG